MTPPLPRHPRCLPTGAALLEIMIGLAIGLLICATALNALHISRALSEITGDAIAMQQDATTALRIIGLQIRQAGSAALDLQPALSAGDATQQGAVVFEPAPEARPDANGTPTMGPSVAAPVVAKSTGATLQLRHANPTEDLFKSPNSTIRGSQQHDCLGQNTSNRLLASIITSTFFVRDGQLMCTGVAGSPQPMISHVKGFAVRMLVQSFDQKQESEYSLFMLMQATSTPPWWPGGEPSSARSRSAWKSKVRVPPCRTPTVPTGDATANSPSGATGWSMSRAICSPSGLRGGDPCGTCDTCDIPPPRPGPREGCRFPL